MNEKASTYSKRRPIKEAAKLLSAVAIGVGGTVLAIDNPNSPRSHHAERKEVTHISKAKIDSTANVFFMGKQVCLNGTIYRPVRGQYEEYEHVPNTGCNSVPTSTNVSVSNGDHTPDHGRSIVSTGDKTVESVTN